MILNRAANRLHHKRIRRIASSLKLLSLTIIEIVAAMGVRPDSKFPVAGKTGSNYITFGLLQIMAEPVKVIINNPFWYLCDRAPGCLCSYRRSGNIPKYIIVPSTGGGAALQILSDDLEDDEKKIVTFQPIGKGNAIGEAMAFAERHETVHCGLN
jgi:hypothetical protein